MDTDRIKRLGFYSISDFRDKASFIKSVYVLLSLDEKRFYKMYVYSNSFLFLAQRDKIWEYLNEPFGSPYYVSDGEL